MRRFTAMNEVVEQLNSKDMSDRKKLILFFVEEKDMPNVVRAIDKTDNYMYTVGDKKVDTTLRVLESVMKNRRNTDSRLPLSYIATQPEGLKKHTAQAIVKRYASILSKGIIPVFVLPKQDEVYFRELYHKHNVTIVVQEENTLVKIA